MGVDYFTNNEKFCLFDFCINSIKGEFVEILCWFFHLPVKWLERLLKVHEVFAVWLWASSLPLWISVTAFVKWEGRSRLSLIFKSQLIFWVFVAAHRPSLVAESRVYSLLWYTGFSLWWLLLLRSTGCRGQGLQELWHVAQMLQLMGSGV